MLFVTCIKKLCFNFFSSLLYSVCMHCVDFSILQSYYNYSCLMNRFGKIFLSFFLILSYLFFSFVYYHLIPKVLFQHDSPRVSDFVYFVLQILFYLLYLHRTCDRKLYQVISITKMFNDIEIFIVFKYVGVPIDINYPLPLKLRIQIVIGFSRHSAQ